MERRLTRFNYYTVREKFLIAFTLLLLSDKTLGVVIIAPRDTGCG